MNSELKNSPGAGVLTGGSFNEFINLKIHDNGGPAGSNNFKHGMYVDADYNLIDGCDIYNNASYGIQLYGNGAAGNNPSNNIVRNTKIHGNATGLYAAMGSGNLVYNNLVYGNLYDGITVHGTNTQVYNNTVYQNGTAGPYGFSISASNAVVRNNISYQNSVNYTDAGSGTVADHNLLGVDAKFVNAAAGDFHLQAGSPAIDAGATISMVTTDLGGLARPQGAGYDIGAFER